MSVGFPRRAMNRQKVARKASVVRSDTISRWTALTVRETKTQMLGVGDMIPLKSIPPIPSSDPGVLIPH